MLTELEEYEIELSAAKKKSVSQLLFKCARLWEERVLEELRILSKTPELRRSHTSLFPHIDLEGTRISTLAERVGVSKQAVSKLVKDLESFGVVERLPDVEDKRAHLVAFSRRGRTNLMRGLSFLQEQEKALEEILGPPQMAGLHDALLTLEAHLVAKVEDKT